jgi:hypothetical protein
MKAIMKRYRNVGWRLLTSVFIVNSIVSEDIGRQTILINDFSHFGNEFC